jgi:hypothetical protein
VPKYFFHLQVKKFYQCGGDKEKGKNTGQQLFKEQKTTSSLLFMSSTTKFITDLTER